MRDKISFDNESVYSELISQEFCDYVPYLIVPTAGH